MKWEHSFVGSFRGKMRNMSKQDPYENCGEGTFLKWSPVTSPTSVFPMPSLFSMRITSAITCSNGTKEKVFQSGMGTEREFPNISQALPHSSPTGVGGSKGKLGANPKLTAPNLPQVGDV